ncbi:transposable element Tcb2 transposase [Trichonephila clavipes]|nr:transposable element Tcb2 transposase [Trichonephila clavipes]
MKGFWQTVSRDEQGTQQLEPRPDCGETQVESIRKDPESVVANGAALARDIWDRGSHYVLSLTLTHRRPRLEWCRARGNWTAAEWNQVVFSDESRFNLSSDDNRVREWRPRGEHLNPAFALQRHTDRTAGVMIWGAIAYNTRSPLVLIRGPMTAQWYAPDILQPHVLPLMQSLPRAIFQQDNAQPNMARMPQDCLSTVTTLPWPARSSDLSPIEHIWDHLEQ